MRVLGLDPGLTCAGYGLVEPSAGQLRMIACGTVRTKGETVAPRLGALYSRLCELLDELCPDAVSVEKVLFNANVRTATSVGQAAGVMLLAAHRAGCEIAEYTPSEMKLAITGDGSAGKPQVQQMVARLLSLPTPPKPPDTADALGLAITHIRARKMKSMRSRMANGA